MMWWMMAACVTATWLSGYALAATLSRRWPMAWGDRLLFALPIGIGWIIWMAFNCSEFLGIPITRLFVIGTTVPLAALGSVWVIRDGRAWYAEYKQEGQTASDSQLWTWAAWAAIGVLLLLMTRQILESWVTPVLNTDALMYHLPFAKIIYQTHALPQYASLSVHDIQYTLPPLIFLWYAIVWLWCDAINLFVAPLTVLIFVVHLYLLVYRTARMILDVEPAAALGAVLVFFLPGTFIENILEWQSSSDFPFIFWGLCVVYLLGLDLYKGEARRWIWVGIFGALSYWTKPFGLVFGGGVASIMICTYVVNHLKHRNIPAFSISYICKIGLISGILVLPFLLRNWLLWENPIYPVALQQLGGYMVDSWTLTNSIFANITPMGQDQHYENWFIIVLMFFDEPGVALAFPLIFVPSIYRTLSARMIGFTAIIYFLFYVISFSSEFGTTWASQKTHSRYLMISAMSLSVLVAYYLDRRIIINQKIWYLLMGANIVLLSGLQIYKIRMDIWSFPALDSLNSIKSLVYEQMPLVLAIVFLITGLIGHNMRQWVVRSRIAIVSVCALFLSYPWPVSSPWLIILQPLNRDRVDWTHIPLRDPYGPWVHQHLSKSAVLLTDALETTRWTVPRQMVTVENPMFKSLFDPGISLDQHLVFLARIGVTHILTHGSVKKGPSPLRLWDKSVPAFSKKIIFRWPFLKYPDSDKYFQLIHHTDAPSSKQSGLRFYEAYIYEIRYPIELQKVVRSDMPRPWLYSYATVGIMGSEEK